MNGTLTRIGFQIKGGIEMKHTDDQVVMELICDIYSCMDDQEKQNWSLDEAKKVVSDQIKIDLEMGRTPLQYDVYDFFDTIQALIETE